MDIRVKYLNNVKFAAEARGHEVICDQPPANGGADEGPTPPEFLLVSLATCAGFYAAQYLKNHKLPAEGLEVDVSAEKLPSPARLGRFRVVTHEPGLPAAHEAGLLRAVNACLIKNTLSHPPEIETVLDVACPELAAS